MKRLIVVLFIFINLCQAGISIAGNPWRRVYSKQLPGDAHVVYSPKYLLFSADEQLLKEQLNPEAKGGGAAIVSLPLPDGSFRDFKVWRSGLLPDELVRKYPELSTYNAVAVDNPNVTAKLDFTSYGFHAMIFAGEVSFIDPGSDDHDGYYRVHYQSDEVYAPERQLNCLVPGENSSPGVHKSPFSSLKITANVDKPVSNGEELRTYRLALSCDHQYAQAVTGLAGPAKSLVLSKMMTTMNRVNGIYERELSVTMVFIANEDVLIFPVQDGDPFGAHNASGDDLIEANQKMCDSLIGTENYDIGHIFSTGGGGLAVPSGVCNPAIKARSVTGGSVPKGDGFDVDYVAHEMGHAFGSQHTFNDNINAFCANNAASGWAYEPGSGSTIMAYAGLCSPDNLQPHSDAYFSGPTLVQIHNYITVGGDSCAVKTPTNNVPVTIPPFTDSFTIPSLTPFELTAPVATGSGNDSVINYCWEQWNLGDFGTTLAKTRLHGPIFRSYPPVLSQTRAFPKNKMILDGVISNAGVNDSSGEKLPDTTRTLKFRLTIRNIKDGYGCFLIPADSMHLHVIHNGEGFKVTSQNEEGAAYLGKTPQTVTWNVAGTNLSPISDSMVDIFISADAGKSWTYNLGTYPNTGSANIILPNPEVSIPAARIKVKGAGNIFFSVNGKDFAIDRNFEAAVHIYPVPTRSVLHILTENSGVVDAAIFNMVGQRVWSGVIDGGGDIPVSLWARGLYVVKLVDSAKRPVVRRILVE